jgi:multiple sugar transport system substrate-binding protein
MIVTRDRRLVGRRALLRGALGLTALGGAGLLAACGQPPAPTQAPAPPAASKPTDAPKPLDAPKPAEAPKPTEAPKPAAQAPAAGKAAQPLRRMYWGSPDQVSIEVAVDKRFTDANSDVAIEGIAVPWPSYRDKLLTMIAGGDVPDVMMVDAYWFPAFIQQKMLRPLDDYLQKDTKYSSYKVIKGFWPLVDHHSADGKVYSKVHSGDTPRIIYFNDHMFKEAGIPNPIDQDKAGTWDWNAYLEAARKLTKGSGQDKVFGAASYPLSSAMYSFIASNGGKVFSDDKKKCLISAPETLEAIQFQTDLIRMHKVSPLPEESQVLGGDLKAFMAKRLGMFISGIWTGADTRNVKDFEWAIAPLPKSPRTGYRRTLYKPNSTSVPAVSKNADVSWRWMSFDPLGQNRLMIDQYTDMAMFEENKQYFLEKSPVKNARAVFDAFDANETTLLQITTKWLEIEKVINDNLQLVRSGEKSLADAARGIEPAVNALLA